MIQEGLNIKLPEAGSGTAIQHPRQQKVSSRALRWRACSNPFGSIEAAQGLRTGMARIFDPRSRAGMRGKIIHPPEPGLRPGSGGLLQIAAWSFVTMT